MKLYKNKPHGILFGADKYGVFSLHPLSALLLIISSSCWAEDYFDPGLLSLGRNIQDVDLSQFTEVGSVPEGNYLVTVYVNQREALSQSMAFRKNAEGNIVPVLTPALLDTLGVNVKHLPAFKDLSKDEPIDNLSELIPASSTRFNLARLRLDISVPQVAMQPNAGSEVNPELWDDGIGALLANYSISAGRNEQTFNDYKTHSNNLFATIRAGANAGAWRVRSTVTHSYVESDGGNKSSDSRSSTNFSNTYLSRDLRGLRSNVLVGESNTGPEVFDSVPFRGVALTSNELMLPSQLRGFAPVVNGIASSNARVTIRQNGRLVYETYVAPGPFAIKDIYQAGLSGDLDVTVTEADGTTRSFIVPFSSLPVMLRTGSWKYEATAGRYSGGVTYHSRAADFALATLIYGLPKNITLYGGSLVAKDYAAASIGSGISLGRVGAISADVTASSARFETQSRQTGESYRLRYSKSMVTTGTSVDLTALRYSTHNYYSFNEFNSIGYALRDGEAPWLLEKRRSSFQTQLSQQLGDWGSVSFRVNRDNFWGSDKTLTGLSAGYNGGYRGVSYGLYYTIDRIKGSGDWPENRQVSFNLSVPFSLFTNGSALQNSYVSTQTTHDNQGRTQSQAGITGSGAGGALSYSLMQGWGNQGETSSSSLNTGYQGSKGSLNAAYAYSTNSRTLNMNASGGVIAHSEGVTLSRTMGSSVALVSAPGAKDVAVTNGGAITDWRGYAVAPYLSEYSKNSIGLDPSSLPENVDLPQSNINVYPTKGAVVKASFSTRIGYQMLMTLRKGSGAVPFGATASLVNDSTAQESNTGIVGDRGQVYLAGLPEAGNLLVSWGKSPDKQCRVNFTLKGQHVSAENPIIQTNGICQ